MLATLITGLGGNAAMTGGLAVEDLDFAYTPYGPKIINDLSYSFTPGKVTAIVARAGTGKSTLLNLMARLQDPQGGRILIDCQDISSVTLATLRRHVVKVSQFPLFVADTIGANLKLAKAEATDAELEEVCRRTGLWQVLEKAAGADMYPPGLPSAQGQQRRPARGAAPVAGGNQGLPFAAHYPAAR